MRRVGVLRVLAGLAAVVLLAGLSAPPLQAEFECKQELMAGAWAGSCDLFGQGRNPPGPWSTVSLSVFDELGLATTLTQTGTTSLTPNGGERWFSFPDRFEVRFTINPDCTGRQTFHNAIPGHRNEGKLVWALDAVCANGQRECQTTFTETPPPGNTDPISIIGVCTLKKLEPADQRLEAKVDAVMRRLGLVPEAYENEEE